MTYKTYALGPLFDIMAELRRVYPSMTLARAQILVTIAMTPGCSNVDLQQRTGLTSASASRITAILGPYGNRGSAELNLIEHRMEPQDRRFTRMFLSPTGETLFRLVGSLLEKYRGRPSEE